MGQREEGEGPTTNPGKYWDETIGVGRPDRRSKYKKVFSFGSLWGGVSRR